MRATGAGLIYWTVNEATANSQLPYINQGYTSADIFVGAAQSGYSAPPLAAISLYALGGRLSLTAGDDIDALAILDDGQAGYNPLNDTVYFSLAGILRHWACWVSRRRTSSSPVGVFPPYPALPAPCR